MLKQFSEHYGKPLLLTYKFQNKSLPLLKIKIFFLNLKYILKMKYNNILLNIKKSKYALDSLKKYTQGFITKDILLFFLIHLPN